MRAVIVSLVILGALALLGLTQQNENNYTGIRSRGLVNVVTVSDATQDLTGVVLNGQLFVYTNAGGCAVTLPAAVAGYNACFYDGNGGGNVDMDTDAADDVYLYGTAIGVGDSIKSAGNLGDFVCLTAIDATYWTTFPIEGTIAAQTWTDDGP